MNEADLLAQQFEQHRARLRAVAYRILGSRADADDAVQEAWLRLARSNADAVENLAGWLTTVVARVALNMLESRKSRREEAHVPVDMPGGTEPEDEAVLADAVGPALLLILDTLSPAERLAFVLHDLFAVPFEDIGDILDRSPVAARQLASRARRRVQGREPREDLSRQRLVVAAFLDASRNGHFDKLLALLHPDVVLTADQITVRMGAAARVTGAHAVAETFVGRARAARLALIDGTPGALWTMNGEPKVAFAFTVEAGQVTGIRMIADPADLAELDFDIIA